jgi:hypothetical protein
VLIGQRHRDRVRMNDLVFDQNVTERLARRARNRQALLELVLRQQSGADQQLAEARAPFRRFRRQIVR